MTINLVCERLYLYQAKHGKKHNLVQMSSVLKCYLLYQLTKDTVFLSQPNAIKKRY